MQTLIKNDKLIKYSKITFFIITSPLLAYVINLTLRALNNLGYYSGTFLRNIYNLVR